jgi:dihydrofolate synthase / folylpolyglutamate synthase
MNYEQVLHYMYEQLPMFHRIGAAAYKPGLDNTIALLRMVGDPQRSLKCVHVAGTNGKGSTSHMVASVLQEAGYKTGLYTSPHLKDFRERIRINGVMIREKDVVDFVMKFKDEWQSISPSFFEITVALCFWYFEKEKIDIAVIETGLGGRLDSTNVITPEVSVITNIGFDHMNLLGDTIEKIAFEKAGIIKENIPVVIGAMRPEARAIMKQLADEMHTTVFDASSLSLERIPSSDLKGNYQDENRRTAYATLETLRRGEWKIAEQYIIDGFSKVTSNTGLLGRWQVLGQSPLIIADVAHNEDGIKYVLKQIADTPHHHLHFVLGLVSDKDVDRVLRLLPKDASYYFCKANIPRGMEANMLREKASEFSLRGEVYDSVRKAYETAKTVAKSGDLVFVGGSVFTVGEVV